MRWFRKKTASLSLLICFVFIVSDNSLVHASKWYNAHEVAGSTEVLGEPINTELDQEPNNNPSCGADPVFLHSGEFFYECTSLHIPGRGMDVSIKHRYRSGKNINHQFGYGWTLNYFYRLRTLSNGNVKILKGDTGREDEYIFNGTNYEIPSQFFESLSQNNDGTWTLSKAHGDKLHFNSNGSISVMEDRNGNQITFSYDGGGLLGHLGKSALSINPFENITLGLDYRLTQITDTVGRDINFTYNSNGRLDRITDYAGREIIYTYDSQTNDLLSIRKPTSPQYPTGLTKKFTYETDHNLKTIEDAKGQVFVTNHYDSEGRVQQQELGSGMFNFDYSVANQTTVTDRKGFVTTYVFNGSGNVLSKEQFTQGQRAGDPTSYITSYTYNNDGMVASVTYPEGNGVVYTYDDANQDKKARANIIEIRRKSDMSAANNNTNDLITTITYENQYNFPKTIMDAKGFEYVYTYDYEVTPSNDHGNVVKIQQPMVNGQVPEVHLTYNNFGQITQTTDPNGNVVQYDYFAATSYLKEVRQDPNGINAITQMTYDTYGNLDKVIDPELHETDYDFNELNWLIQETNPLTFVTKYTYDQNANITKIERQENDPGSVWQTTTFDYDTLNNLTLVRDPLNRDTVYNYDLNELMSSMTDHEGNSTVNAYDERNLLYTVTDANTPQGITQYDYDHNGNLKRLLDANSNATDYTYDGFDRLANTTYADAKFSHYDYDKNSNLTRHITPSTKPIEYDYDELNRRTNKRFPQTTALNTSYIYDVGSRLTNANNAVSDITYVYDALNRVVSDKQVLGGNTYTVGYGYDLDSKRTDLTYPSAKKVEYVYDINDRLKDIKVGTTASTPVTMTSFQYDPLDRRTQKDYVGIASPLRTTYSFDLANQLSQIHNTITAGTNISQYAYSVYDGVGNRKNMERTYQAQSTETTNYGYNNIYELESVTGAQSHSFDYDNVANRTNADGTTYTPNNLNQYTSIGSQSYTYDDNANLTNDGNNTYSYDEQNRLSTLNNVSDSAQYEYDAFNRRSAKIVNGTTTHYVYDGDTVIAEYNSSGGLQAEYVTSLNIDEVLTMDRNGATYYYHYDGLGSVTEITDGNGTIVENYTYDVYGQPSVTTSSIENPYMFTGRRWDEESGIYYYRARYYDATIGRFLQRDPVGYYDSMNLFQYVGSNPINFIDPYGELKIPFTDIWIPAGEGYGQEALNYWAQKAACTKSSFAGGFYNSMGAFASLWTPETSNKTASVLVISFGISRYLARPYYQYYPAGNLGYSSKYLTRGLGWKAPYKTGKEAVKKLSLPKYNPGTAVRRVKVKPFQYIKGPGRVKPEFGQSGGGIEYLLP